MGLKVRPSTNIYFYKPFFPDFGCSSNFVFCVWHIGRIIILNMPLNFNGSDGAKLKFGST